MSVMHLLQQMGNIAMLSMFVGVAPALMGVAYVLWPTEAKLALMRPLSLAAIFAALTGFVGGVINNLVFTINHGESPTSATFMAGLLESLVPLFVAFGSLTIAWLLVALGLRRTV